MVRAASALNEANPGHLQKFLLEKLLQRIPDGERRGVIGKLEARGWFAPNICSADLCTPKGQMNELFQPDSIASDRINSFAAYSIIESVMQDFLPHGAYKAANALKSMALWVAYINRAAISISMHKFDFASQDASRALSAVDSANFKGVLVILSELLEINHDSYLRYEIKTALMFKAVSDFLFAVENAGIKTIPGPFMSGMAPLLYILTVLSRIPDWIVSAGKSKLSQALPGGNLLLIARSSFTEAQKFFDSEGIARVLELIDHALQFRSSS